MHRPAVIAHEGVYYLYAVQHENEPTASMRRWRSRDGLSWQDEGRVMDVTQRWERGLSNMAVVVGDDGLWRMIYTGADAPPAPQFGYAWSRDGLTWTKHEDNPVITGFYGGDPFLAKISDWYYLWHSEGMGGSLRIACRRSRDLIEWQRVSAHAEMNYSQPWERGVAPEEGGTTSGWYGHLTDATLCEADGRVYLIYQGAQTPLGVATFAGSMTDLAARLERPPLSQWEPSPFAMVEGGTLALSDNETERSPLVARVEGAGEAYVVRARMRCEDGPTQRLGLVVRHVPAAFARLWLHDAGTVYYQECLNGLMSRSLSVGWAAACDREWHDWEVAIEGREVRVTVDGHAVGSAQTSSPLMGRVAVSALGVGFTAHDTWLRVAGLTVTG